ncbi:MAG TPA: carbohydrate ABC transporter permease [Clostridia bacterium]|nr:carbohydrate ABC transporter permease [Clostridia bacterium]
MIVKMKKPKKQELAADRVLDAVILAVLLILLVATVYPLYFVVIASFSDPGRVIQGEVFLLPKGFTLAGYEKVVQYEKLWLGYRNTIFYTIFHTAIATFVTLLTGFALSRATLPGRRGIMLFMAFTMYFSGGMVPSYLLLKNMGFIGNPFAYLLIGTVSVYNVIITRTFMESNIPDTLMEAASIDGCNMRRFFVSIVLPLSPAIIAILVLFYAVGQWNSWFSAMLYLRGDEQMPLQNVLRNILSTSTLTFETGTEASYGSSDADAQTLLVESMRYAVIIVSSLPVLCLYPFVQKYFIRGVMVGAIKG